MAENFNNSPGDGGGAPSAQKVAQDSDIIDVIELAPEESPAPPPPEEPSHSIDLVPAATLPAPPPPPPAPAKKPRKPFKHWRVVKITIGILVVAAMLFAGLRLRAWIFPASAKFRFQPDIHNAWYWGSFAVTNARPPHYQAAMRPGAAGLSWSVFWHRMTTVYDRAVHRGRSPYGYPLDYPPGRLTVVSAWVALERTLHPALTAPNDSVMGPLLWFNTAMELLGAMGFFFLVRHWVNRAQTAPPPRVPWRSRGRTFINFVRRRTPQPGLADDAPLLTNVRTDKAWMLGILAAAIFWFNPNIIQSAHTWVQYDVWVIPFFVWALYFASLDLFVLAGVAIAIGSLLKGQELFGGVMFILWPLFALWPRRAADVLFGAIATFALGAMPFMLHSPLDWLYLTSVAVAAVTCACWLSLRGRVPVGWYAMFAVPAAALVLWPITSGSSHNFRWPGALLAAWVIAIPLVLAPRRIWWYALSTFALAMVVIGACLPADMLWLKTGYLFGTTVRHSWGLLSLSNACGLANILQSRYGWRIEDIVFTMHAFGGAYPVTMRTFLGSLYLLTMILCAMGAAQWYRRNNPRFLLAMVTPWITFFALAPQMYERYLIWGGALLASAAVALDPGYVLLGILLSIFSLSMTLSVQLGSNPGVARKLLWINNRTQPGLAYAILLAAAICLYGSVWPRRRKTQFITNEVASG